MIAKRAMDLPARSGSGYPERYRSRVLPREKRALGDAFGLQAIGVNLTVLAPGKESALRHRHTHEDELVYVLEGELLLRTDDGDELLVPGMVCGFRAGDGVAHQLVNQSASPATYLEISNRHPGDTAEYPDDDLVLAKVDGKHVYTRKDGSAP